MNHHAAALGRLARGVPKNYTPAERARRAARMRSINASRHVHAPYSVRVGASGSCSVCRCGAWRLVALDGTAGEWSEGTRCAGCGCVHFPTPEDAVTFAGFCSDCRRDGVRAADEQGDRRQSGGEL